MSSLRLAMVSEHASPLATLGGVDAGGQNVHVAALATQLARRGIGVTVYTRRDDPSLDRRVVMPGGVVVEHIDAGPPEPISKDELFGHMDTFAAELQRRWWHEPPEVVHAHFWMSGYAALAAARSSRIPVVQTFHALGVVKRRHQGAKDTSPPERLQAERQIIELADRIVATCSDEVFELCRLGADRHRISIVPCGVDPALFTPHGPAEDRGPLPHRIAVVGRLVERKGIGNVITALADVPDTELIVAGGPAVSDLDADPEIARLRSLAASVGVDERVVFRGRLERIELPPLLRSADAVVCVPWYEPFGIVPIEAMACGVPVVASAVGGLIDTVVDGVTGVHLPPRQPVVLAAALRELLDQPTRLRAMGRAGAERVRQRYQWSRVAAETLAVYRAMATTTSTASLSSVGR